VVVRADIPQGRVYDVLNQLHSEGAVVKQGAQPKQYAAQNPRTLIEPKQQQFDSMAKETIEGLEPAYEMNLAETQNPAWVTTNISGVATQVRDLLEDISEELLLIERSLWFEDDYLEKLQELADNGVDVRIIGWQARQRLDEIADSLDGVSVRQRERVQTAFYIGDNERVILNLEEGQTGIIFRNNGMGNHLRKRFKDLYEKAEEVSPNNA
jgi:sugar-specific transcriptional regulator TrmB